MSNLSTKKLHLLSGISAFSVPTNIMQGGLPLHSGKLSKDDIKLQSDKYADIFNVDPIAAAAVDMMTSRDRELADEIIARSQFNDDVYSAFTSSQVEESDRITTDAFAEDLRNLMASVELSPEVKQHIENRLREYEEEKANQVTDDKLP